MPATLSEAFGENFEIVPSLSKRSKKSRKNKKSSKYHNLDQKPDFGQYISKNNFTAPEEPRYINAEVPPSLGDQQYQAIKPEDYGPSDYSIKPVDANEYIYNPYQSDQNLQDLEEDEVPVNQMDDDEDKPESFTETEEQVAFAQNNQMMEFSKKLDLIIDKLNGLDEPVQENIHDIILFVIFGVFVIFIMDSIYRVGKVTF